MRDYNNSLYRLAHRTGTFFLFTLVFVLKRLNITHRLILLIRFALVNFAIY